MATFADCSPPFAFDPSTIGDNTLNELRKLSFSVMDKAPRFGQWIHKWIDWEQSIRAGEKQRGADVHSLCMPGMNNWRDDEVGAALEACLVLVYCTRDSALGTFIDRIMLGVGNIAAERLTQRSKPQ